MDPRAHESAGQGLHGLVAHGAPAAQAAASASPRIAARLAFALAAAVSLVSGIVGGLLRAGVAVPGDAVWMGHAVLAHAFLMMGGFLGTVIGLERAVAAKAPLALAAPIASALAGVLALLAMPQAPWLMVVAALAFIAANAVVVSRQMALHTVLLLVGAGAWLVGNLLHAWRAQPAAVVPWWFSFLILTIAAERLEMTRLMRRRPGASTALLFALGTLLAGSALFAVSPRAGGVTYGLALLGLATWLLLFDVARRTVRAHGLSRYMAVCLLLGYGWLAVAGLAWIAASLGVPARDVALHALGLGFVFSMMLAHGPVILPALARIKLQHGWPFYLPLALLQASLLARLALARFDITWLALGALGNAAAIVLFALTVVGAALVWRRRHGRRAAADMRP